MASTIQPEKASSIARRRLDARRQVIEAYDMVLRRWPDPTGLDHFSGLIMNGVLDKASLAADLYTSDEAHARPAHPIDPGTPENRMAALSGLFRAAEEGQLMRDHADADGHPRVGFLAERLLNDDIGPLLAAYSDAVRDGATHD